MVDTQWKIAAWSSGAIFASVGILAAAIGPTVPQASADNAVRACRAAAWGTMTSPSLGSRSISKPDGTWTPTEVSLNSFSMSQRILDNNVMSPGSTTWVCSASMTPKDRVWTVTWTTGRSLVSTTYYPDATLHGIAQPRDLSG
ncbi:MAG TPA: hypothetical protein VF317_06195 [Dermatophilaceae bacterium]